MTRQVKSNCLRSLVSRGILADTHAHLDFEMLSKNYQAVLNRAQQKGIEEIWLMSIDRDSFTRNLEFIAKAQKYTAKVKSQTSFPILRLAAGIDMEVLIPGSEVFSARLFSFSEQQLLEFLQREWQFMLEQAAKAKIPVEIVGEVGIDHYHLQNAYENSEITRKDVEQSHKLQQVMFEFFLNKAGELLLPLSIHTRGAEELCLEIVGRYSAAAKLSGVFHSYTGPLTLINEIKALGFYIGLNGIVSYKSASHILRRVLRDLKEKGQPSNTSVAGHADPKANSGGAETATLLKNLYQAGYVLETDAPYLVTAGADSKSLKQAYGERLNDPAGVADTLEFLGEQV